MLSLTYEVLIPSNFYMCMILSLFNPIAALVLLTLSLLLVHIHIFFWKSTALPAIFYPWLWNELPKEVRKPWALSLSSDLTHTSSSSPSSPLSPSIALFLFHAGLNTHLSINPSYRSLPQLFGLISRILGPFPDLISSIFLFCSFFFSFLCLVRVFD